MRRGNIGARRRPGASHRRVWRKVTRRDLSRIPSAVALVKTHNITATADLVTYAAIAHQIGPARPKKIPTPRLPLSACPWVVMVQGQQRANAATGCRGACSSDAAALKALTAEVRERYHQTNQ